MSNELTTRHRRVMPAWQALYYEEPIELVSGEGRYVVDRDGRRYLDFFGGILTTSVGHAVPEVVEAMALNYLTPVRMTLATLPGMLERGRGCHLYVSSLGGRLGIGTEAAYCGTKFALAGWAESVAIDLWDTPVDVRLVLWQGPVHIQRGRVVRVVAGRGDRALE